MQGNCAKPPPATWALAQAPTNNQCVLRVKERLLRNSFSFTGHRLWLDNVYVHAKERPQGEELRSLLWQGGAAQAANSKLWITNSVFEGNQANSSATILQDASVYIGGAFRRTSRDSR